MQGPARHNFHPVVLGQLKNEMVVHDVEGVVQWGDCEVGGPSEMYLGEIGEIIETKERL